MDFAKVKKMLAERGLKQCWVAEQIGIDKKSFNRILRGESPARKATIFLLCKVLNVTESDVIIKE